MSKKSYDYSAKIVIVGDAGVGKSCIINRFSNNEFDPNYIVTIGVDFKIKTLSVGDKTIKLILWDTAGQERFRSLTESYYRGADLAIIVYDITNGKSFDNVGSWIRNWEHSSNDSTLKYLVGNKCDLSDIRVVSHQKGITIATQHAMPFYEVSAKTDLNISDLFYDIARRLIEKKAEADQVRATLDKIELAKSKQQSKSRCC